MLPPGHIAAGYLVAQAVIYIANPPFSPHELNQLKILGAFSAFAPDLDMVCVFWREKGFRHTGEHFDHRQYITHTPFIWLFAGAAVALLGNTIFWFYAGLMIWLGSWSHLLLDSGYMGVRWLYPFRNTFFALKSQGVTFINKNTGFFNHWWHEITLYYQTNRYTFYAETLLICSALIIFFSTRN